MRHLIHRWPTTLLTCAALGALALLWGVRDRPVDMATFVRLDALSAFFLFTTFAGAALVSLRHTGPQAPWRLPGLVAGATAAYSLTLTPAIIVAYLLLMVLLLSGAQPATRPGEPQVEHSTPLPPLRIGRALVRASPLLIAAGSLAVGYGALALRGALHYDERTAGLALGSFVFWFVLLAALAPYLPFRWLADSDPWGGIWRIAWFYPLVRLYSLGPWNTGWSVATLLFGGAVALWSSSAALLQQRSDVQRQRMPPAYAALALAGFGLGTGAGIAAGCYGVLAYLILVTAYQPSEAQDRAGRGEADSGTPQAIPLLTWLVSGALPFTAPFTAAWMLIGAATAGGVIVLAGVAWLVTLLNAIATVVRAPMLADRERTAAATASAALGVGSPVVVLVLIEPVIGQLQGGLTPYGDVNIWPWIGLAARDSASTQVTALPSVAVVALMLVLSAFVYLAVRLRESLRGESLVMQPITELDHAPPAAAEAQKSRFGALVAFLQREVAWLQSLSAPESEQRGDGE